MVETQVDVRSLPTWERHPKIFAAFDRLRGLDSLVVVTDHDPRPLRSEFEAKRHGQFVWNQRQLGETQWEARLRRFTPGNSDDPTIVLLQQTIFATSSPETQKAFAAAALERTVGEGALVLEQDADWPYLGIVRAGALAAIVGSRAGRDQVLFELFPLETFAEAEALDGGRTLSRVVATSPVARVVMIPREIVLSCTELDAACARALAVTCAQRSRIVVDRLSSTVARPTIARIAAAILPYSSAEAGLAPTRPPLRRMTQSQLAITAGTVKEVVARAIAELESAGALRREAGRIARVDRAKLSAFADVDRSRA